MCNRLVGRICLAAVVTLSLSLSALAADDEIEFTPPAIEVPEGFTIELVAGPPLVKYPMMAAYDEQGRLFIAESDGQNLDKAGLLEQKPRFVRRIEDTDGDGKFDKSTIFADQMVMPEGALCLDGSFYIMSAPFLWRMKDLDGDGVADVREQLVGEMDLIGNANQHGPYLTPAGRLLFSGGTFGYNLVGSDGSGPGKGNWASVFSCNLEGGDVRVESHAGINPVEVEFTPEGEMIGTCAIFDRVGGRCDALVHWVHGGSYAERLREPNLKHTGRYLPALIRWGQVAPSGLVRIRGSQFGDEYRDNYFACHFNTHEVRRIKLERLGATYRGDDEVFARSENTDFHPADILEDADGNLILIDTGAWLTMGCPTSKDISHGNYGAIYRIRRTDSTVGVNPSSDGAVTADWDNLPLTTLGIAALSDSFPSPIWNSAVSTFVAKGNRVVPPLTRIIAGANYPETVELRRNAVWILSRIGTVPARAAVCAALADEDAGVRQAAVHAVGVLREPFAVERLMTIVVNDELPVRREAATALGLIGEPQAVPALLESLSTADDEFLEHALIYALIEIGDTAAIEPGFAADNPRTQRGALIALDQIAGESLAREMVAPLLATTDSDLQQATLDVIATHPSWAGELIGLLREALSAEELTPAQQAVIVGAVPAFAADESVQSLVAQSLADAAVSTDVLLVLLEAVGRIEQPQLPESWTSPLAALLSHADEAVRRQLLASLVPYDIAPLAEALRAAANDASQPEGIRLAAVSLLARSGTELNDGEVELLVEMLQADAAPVDRLTAANSLSSANLSVQQLQSLLPVVSDAGPLELGAVLQSFAHVARSERLADESARDIGLALLDAIEGSAGKDALSPASIRAAFASFPAEIVAAAEERFPTTAADDDEQRAMIDTIEQSVDAGSIDSGKQIFFSTRTACSGCHKAGGQGGSVGPDLSQIAKIRTPRQLAEAVLLPSATLANGFESYTIATATGQLHTGLIRRETADAIYLVGTDGKEFRVLRDEIDEVKRSDTSIMPQGLDKQMTAEQLRDLVAYLNSLK